MKNVRTIHHPYFSVRLCEVTRVLDVYILGQSFFRHEKHKLILPPHLNTELQIIDYLLPLIEGETLWSPSDMYGKECMPK